MTHCDLTVLSPEMLEKELVESKSVLESILGSDVTSLSFPHGKYDKVVLEMAKKAGYKRVFTIKPSLAFSNGERFVAGRIKVEPADWPLEFKLKILGAYRWLPIAFRLKKWLLGLPKLMNKG
jgi:peptidoglycan/xylan/chitin deacetylase (PgdA/CDA1 family)